jgi:hypothetical protein
LPEFHELAGMMFPEYWSALSFLAAAAWRRASDSLGFPNRLPRALAASVGNIPVRPDLQWSNAAMIESISAITLATHNMSRAVRFYRTLGFEVVYGGDDAAFTSFRAGTNYLNLTAQPPERNWSWWGRVIFYQPTLIPSMRAWARPATVQTRHRVMANGGSGSST